MRVLIASQSVERSELYKKELREIDPAVTIKVLDSLFRVVDLLEGVLSFDLIVCDDGMDAARGTFLKLLRQARTGNSARVLIFNPQRMSEEAGVVVRDYPSRSEVCEHFTKRSVKEAFQDLLGVRPRTAAV